MKDLNPEDLIMYDLQEIMFDHDYDFDQFLMSYYVFDDILQKYYLNREKKILD
jgi:hypothetical protein